MYCNACGYSLDKLTEHRCPECGMPFNPEDLTSFKVPRKKSRWWIGYLVIGAGLFIILFVEFMNWATTHPPRPQAGQQPFSAAIVRALLTTLFVWVPIMIVLGGGGIIVRTIIQIFRGERPP